MTTLPLKLDPEYDEFIKKLIAEKGEVVVPITLKTNGSQFIQYYPSIGSAKLKEVNGHTLALEVSLPEPFSTTVTNGSSGLSLKPRCSGQPQDGVFKLLTLDSLEIGIDLE